MRLKRRIILLAAFSASTLAVGADIDSLIMVHQSMMPEIASQSFNNPALKQWRQNYSYTDISGHYGRSDSNEAIDPRLGEGSSMWRFKADSQIKYKTSTLWGTAAYGNGRQRGVNWNESSDADIIYPYFTADSIGGDLNVETYSFAGGYADHTDRWAWGAAISYDAGHYFRKIDPRPRNTTSRLDLSVGGAVRLGRGDYHAGVSVNFRKYKQSCDIEFVNEMADNSIWHTTGLGTHYERFASSGYNHYYDGRRWGATVDLFPSSGRGLVVALDYTSFKFDHILTDLNKLPLETATDNTVGASVGWLAPGRRHDWAVDLALSHGKRTGTENLFGDATGNVYPQIGALDLYTHTLTAAHVDLLWQWHPSADMLLSVNPRASWTRSLERYADPRREMLLSALAPEMQVKAARRFGGKWIASLSMVFAYVVPTDNKCNLPYNAAIPAGLQNIDIRRYDILSKSRATASVGASVYRALNSNYALSISADYSRGSYHGGIHTDNLSASVAFIF